MGTIQKNKLIKNRIKHAKNRFQERHAIFLSENQYFQLVAQIISSESIFVTRFSNNYTLHKVNHQNNWYFVVYSKAHKIILTVYQSGWVKIKDGEVTIKPKRKKKKKPKSDRVHWKLRIKTSKTNLV